MISSVAMDDEGEYTCEAVVDGGVPRFNPTPQILNFCSRCTLMKYYHNFGQCLIFVGGMANYTRSRKKKTKKKKNMNIRGVEE